MSADDLARTFKPKAYHLKGLVSPMNHSLPITFKLFWIFSPSSPLFVSIRRIWIICFAAKVFRWRYLFGGQHLAQAIGPYGPIVTYSVIHPRWPSHKIRNIGTRKLLHLRNDLYAGATISDDSDSLVAVIIFVLPICRMSDVSFKVVQSRDLRPFVVAGYCNR
jgi:hypothetical protein